MSLIRRGLLSDFFAGVAVKRLSAVETSPVASNQHELNGAKALRRLLGDADRKRIPAHFVWLGEEQAGITDDSTLSWYDSRRRHATRSEYRLYYPNNEVSALMKPGDTFFLAMRPDGSAMAIVTPAVSTIQNQLLWLFGIEAQPDMEFTVREITANETAGLDFAARFILDELGIELEEPESEKLDALVGKFGLKFPSTREFSELARTSIAGWREIGDPDETLLLWMEREEQLFRRLERRIVDARLHSGFISDDGADEDGFLNFSLSVQNRRKSRAGQALENHLEALLLAHRLGFARGAETENRNRPDFLFPGPIEYRDARFPAARLTMLGAKSTLKDRWRQVLSEAARIDEKHLLTLEPSISENQTDEMKAKNLRLVIPKRLHSTFRHSQRPWLMSIHEFISLVKARASA